MTDHAAEARRLLASDGAEHGDQGFGQMTNALTAQVHATLALKAQTARLADAQETANLIAAGRLAHLWASNPDSMNLSGWARDVEAEIHSRLADEDTRTRLDLTPTTPNQEQQP